MPRPTPEKLKTLLAKLEELPQRRYAQMLRSKLDDLLQQMDAPFLDQHPGRRIPAMISCMYQFGPTSPRRVTSGQGGTGFDRVATLAAPGQFILPRNRNVLIGRDRSFYWCRTAVHGFISSTFTADPGYAVPVTSVNPKPVGDIFSSVLSENGGALILDNMLRDIRGEYQLSGLGAGDIAMANWSADFHIYDKSRGRFFSDAPVPMEFFTGGQVANKALSYNMRFDAGSEIEPRLYLKEFRPFRLETDQAYAANQSRGYVNVVFIGYQELEHDEDPAQFSTLKDGDF